MRYSRQEAPFWWFYENTSTWMEDVLWPGWGTLYYRSFIYTSPLTRSWYEFTRTDGSGFEYVGGLWPKFLAEYYGADAPRRVWELCGYMTGDHPEKSTDSVLRRDYSADLHTALAHYALWKNFSGTRDDGQHYYEGYRCTTAVLLRSHSSYPASGDEGTWDPKGPGGMDLVQFTTSGSQDLTITFNGQNGYTWRAYVLARRGSTTYEQRIMLDANGDGSITIPAWMVTTAVLVPVVVHWTDGSHSTPSLTFSYSASASDEPTGLAGEGARQPALELLASSPVRGPATIRYVLPRGSHGTLRFIDASGRLVRELALEGTGSAAAVTLGREAVPAGVYFCQLSSCGDFLGRKLTLE
jgi:hypothetical protein